MDAALDLFTENMQRARTLSGLADALPRIGMAGIDTSDLHRAAIVLGVSALDFFVHDVVREGMIKIYKGEIPPTDASNSFRVPLSSVSLCVGDPADVGWLDSSVRSAHSFLTFQHPDKIADAVRLISPIKLWESVGVELGEDTKAVKIHLTSIVDRRNKIAHEADMDSSSIGERWPIDAALVTDALDYVEKVVRAIAKVADASKPSAAPPPPAGSLPNP